MSWKLFLAALYACPLAHAGVNPGFGKLPLRFELARDPGEHAKFVARGNGYTLLLSDGEAILKSRSATVRMKMVDGNPSPKITPQRPLPRVTNYLIGNDPSKWRTGVAGFARVEYRGIYPGVDLVYYGKDGCLEYDFVVAPGSDPRQVRMVFDGATSLKLDESGDLIIGASGQALRFRRPVLYQEIHGEKRPVAGRYSLHGRQVGFTVSAYDASMPLVIDPVLLYSTLFGGGEDAIFAIATDTMGNVYLTGQTFGWITTVNPEQAKFDGNYEAVIPNAFITKINAAGTALVYSTFIGGSEGDRAFGIAVDSAGNAYIAGYTQSSDFPTVNPIQPELRAASNAFVTKLNAAGSALVYSTYLGGSGSGPVRSVIDRANAIAVDSAGDAYVAGSTTSSDFPTASPIQATLPGQKAAFVTKINAAGSALAYSTYLGGSATTSGASAQNAATSIAVDSTGGAYVTGNACSSNFPTFNPLQASNKSACNVFITKFTPTGSSLAYSTYLGGSGGNSSDSFAADSGPCSLPSCAGLGGDSSGGIAVDSAGNAYLSGTTISTDFPVVNALQPALGAGNNAAFAAKLNASGSALIYSTYLGGGGSATAIATDSVGNAYITGSSGGAFPLVKPLQLTNKGAFVAELNAAGSALVYSTYFGDESDNVYVGAEVQAASAIAVDSAGNTYFAGAAGTAFPLVDAIQTTAASPFPQLGSPFLAKIGPADTAGLAVAPVALNFPNVFLGASAAPQTATLLAAGSQPLNIASITASGDFTQSNNCGSSLAAGSTCAVNATFTPTAEGSRAGTLTVTSNAGSPQSVSLTGFGLMPALSGGAQNAASFSGANVAGSLASVFGSDLAVNAGFASGLPLPTTIQWATVAVTGPSGTYSAPLTYASPVQINFQIPWEAAGASQVTLKVDSVSIPLNLSATAPGIYSLNSQGTGPGAIIISNAGLFAQPVGSVPNEPSRPVNGGEFISIYANGLGALMTAPPPDGSAAMGLSTIAAAATVSIGGITVTPSFAGLAPGFVGLYQVDAQVPTSVASGGAVPVFLIVGGAASNTVTIAVQ